jgi:hypothetical protein
VDYANCRIKNHYAKKKKKYILSLSEKFIQTLFTWNKDKIRFELTCKVFNWTQRVGVVKTFISVALLSSGSLGSKNSFFTKAFIPTSFLYRVRIGAGGIKSSLLAAWPKSYFKAHVSIKRWKTNLKEKSKLLTEHVWKIVNWKC